MVSTPSSHRTRAPQTKSRSNAKKIHFPLQKTPIGGSPLFFRVRAISGIAIFQVKQLSS